MLLFHAWKKILTKLQKWHILFNILALIFFFFYFFSPKTALLQEKYNENHKKFRAQAEEGTIDDNPLLALKYLRTTRAGEAEAQKISLKWVFVC